MTLVVMNPPADAGNIMRPGFDPRVGKIPWRRAWQPIPVFLPGESRGQRRLVGYSPWSHKGVRHVLATTTGTCIDTGRRLVVACG